MRAPPGSSQVHVHTVSLEAAPGSRPELWADLSADEHARANRYATPQLRQRFVMGRGLLRWLLSAYLPIAARDIVFGYGDHGKPHLVGKEGLAFNLSHADDMAIYAITAGREVGIDIESTARDVDVDGLARTAFSPQERATLAGLPADARHAAFFRIWTRKEAYIKVLGEGFTYPTRTFSVSHCAHDDALLGDERDSEAPRRWRVSGLDAPRGFAAALAVAGRDCSVIRFDADTGLPDAS